MRALENRERLLNPVRPAAEQKDGQGHRELVGKNLPDRRKSKGRWGAGREVEMGWRYM